MRTLKALFLAVSLLGAPIAARADIGGYYPPQTNGDFSTVNNDGSVPGWTPSGTLVYSLGPNSDNGSLYQSPYVTIAYPGTNGSSTSGILIAGTGTLALNADNPITVSPNDFGSRFLYFQAANYNTGNVSGNIFKVYWGSSPDINTMTEVLNCDGDNINGNCAFNASATPNEKGITPMLTVAVLVNVQTVNNYLYFKISNSSGYALDFVALEPEPASIAILGAGLLALHLARRRRRRG